MWDSLFKNTAGTLIDNLFKAVDGIVLSDKDKEKFKKQMTKIANEHEYRMEQLYSKKYELLQTIHLKELEWPITRAIRPMTIVFSMILVLTAYLIFPICTRFFTEAGTAEVLEIPGPWWAFLTTYTSVYAAGRSYEKRGKQNKLSQLITGNPDRKKRVQMYEDEVNS